MDRTRRFAEDTTFHGIKDFLRFRSRCALVLWGVLIGACVSNMLYETVMVARQYASNPTATQVSQLYLEQYPYPRMLFCSKEWMNETKVAELNLTKPLLVYALSLLQDVVLDAEDRALFLGPKRAHDVQAIESTDRRLRTFLADRNLTNYMSLYEMIANEPHAVARCEQCDSIGKQVLATGVCYRIRLKPATPAFLIQTPPLFRYSEPRADERHLNLLPNYTGAYATDTLYVSYMPQNDFFSFDPILLNRNKSYIVRIKPILYRRVNNPPRKPCAHPLWARKHNYSQLMCYFKCEEMHKTGQCEKCNFLGYHNGSINQNDSVFGEVCTTLLHDPHLRSCKITEQQVEAFNKCAKHCQPLCHEWVYETTVIQVAQRKLLFEIPEEDITVAFSYQIRYGETLIEEVATYSWDTFISNVGGQLSLWLGASVVSVLQLLNYIIGLIYDRITNGAGENTDQKLQNAQGNGQCANADSGIYTLTQDNNDRYRSVFITMEEEQSVTNGLTRSSKYF